MDRWPTCLISKNPLQTYCLRRGTHRILIDGEQDVENMAADLWALVHHAIGDGGKAAGILREMRQELMV